MSKPHSRGADADFTTIQQEPLQPNTTRTRKPFILKSLTIILLLTVLVLAINYYLISNCPSSETASSQEPNALVRSQSNDHANSIDVTGKTHVVSVSVYYEILCPDSKSFILHQVVPAQKKFGNLINVRFVPFGKARYSKTNDGAGDWQFSCQHGPEECHGNKLHACLVSSYATNQTQLTSMVACSMDKYKLWGATISSITSVTGECRQKYAPDDAVSSSPILCNDASALLQRHGEEVCTKGDKLTLHLNPAVTFIPTIAIDGSLSNQRQILRDLSTVICKKLKQTNKSVDC